MSETLGKYPNTFYRVSLKAIIRDNTNRILVVKENSEEWSLPGGGIDHGEDIEQALARELYEEVLIDKPFTYTYVGAESFYIEKKQAWLLWIIYDVKPEVGYTYGIGNDASEISFIDPKSLEHSSFQGERLTSKWALKNLR